MLIGLLQPSQRSRAGYRLYDAVDLLRLQQILIGRYLGLSLEDIPSLARGTGLRPQARPRATTRGAFWSRARI
jgi:MerR family transcriptional regulator, thiopeptide resistance regulator